MANGNGETSSGPQPNTWYPLRLGSSFVESSPSTKFCTLRYEFKPASIDKTQPGILHKNKENRVSVEFHNNQPGKPKVAFEGSSEDYKETDAVLFFDGDEFKLEKLHRAFKSLKHKRVPGEANGLTGLSGACANGAGPSTEAHSPPLPKVARTQAVNRPSMPVEVEKIDIRGPDNTVATRPVNNKTNTAHQPSNPNPFSPSYHDTKPYDQDEDEDHDEHLDILGDDEPGTPNPLPSSHHTNAAVGFDINVPSHNAESDDDIDLFDDMPAENDGLSAAQALRAQVNGSGTGDVQFEQGAQVQETSSSGGESSSSGSSSASGSGSGSSSSSESEGSDADGGGADSASSADEFKPASIDKTQPGTLHKNKENRVSVEFHNHQPGKPKVAFEGIREDYKETDAVLFFDGGAFKLEKLHCAYNSLKHKRVSGESNGLTGLSSVCANGGWSSAEAHYPLPKVARTQAVNRPSTHAIPVEVEKIDIGGPENNAENDGLRAAQALWAQVNGSATGDAQFQQGAQGQETSSSDGESSSSGSSSASGSGSGSSSSSESEGSDADGGGADSACSPGDIDIF